MKHILVLLTIYFINTTDINDKFEETKNTDWRNGIKYKRYLNFGEEFFRANEKYISKIKINENDKDCIAMIANEICLTRFNINNTIFFSKNQYRYEINPKLMLFYNKNLTESKIIMDNIYNKTKIIYNKTQIDKIVTMIYQEISVKLHTYYFNNKKQNCISKGYNYIHNFPIEVKTGIASLFKKLPNILNTNGTLILNINHNIINCDFDALSKNIKYLSTLTENKIYYKNISNLIDSAKCAEKKNCKSSSDIILTKDNNSSLNNEISSNTEKLFKISVPKGFKWEIEVNNTNSFSKNKLLGNIEGSVNYSSPNCVVNNVDKSITKSDNKVYFNEDFLNNWNYKNLSVNNCSQYKKDFELNKNVSASNDFFILFNYFKTIRTLNDKISLVKDEDYLSLKDDRKIYDVYLNIRSNKSSIKVNFKALNKNDNKNDNIMVNFIKGLNEDESYLKEIDIIVAN